ncbi:MAG: divalent-cation tolerance protein CutA [Candidatus Bathyarchaeia archaeon]
MNGKYVVIMITTASKNEAERIAQLLLQDKLIACANLFGPVNSFFHWAGKIENSEEYLMFMKTREDLFDKVSEVVRAMHSYEVPEILMLPICDGLKAYLKWLDECLQ